MSIAPSTINDVYLARVVARKKCPECKKMFEWYGDKWVYKGRRRGVMQYWCSWKCWRAEDHRKETKLRGENCFE